MEVQSGSSRATGPWLLAAAFVVTATVLAACRSPRAGTVATRSSSPTLAEEVDFFATPTENVIDTLRFSRTGTFSQIVHKSWAPGGRGAVRAGRYEQVGDMLTLTLSKRSRSEVVHSQVFRIQPGEGQGQVLVPDSNNDARFASTYVYTP